MPPVLAPVEGMGGRGCLPERRVGEGGRSGLLLGTCKEGRAEILPWGPRSRARACGLRSSWYLQSGMGLGHQLEKEQPSPLTFEPPSF